MTTESNITLAVTTPTTKEAKGRLAALAAGVSRSAKTAVRSSE
jgi:hypothetical protein